MILISGGAPKMMIRRQFTFVRFLHLLPQRRIEAVQL
jgi:hypothetical protein